MLCAGVRQAADAAGNNHAPRMLMRDVYQPPAGAVDLSAVLREIEDARREEAARLLRCG